MRVLIVEDNETIGQGVQKALQARGDSADHARSLAEARGYLDHYAYDLAILDLNLPDGYGLDLMPDIQSAEAAPSVLVLTAQSAVSDRVKGLDAGAEDYLVKPFELDELLARLRVLARRRQGKQVSAVYSYAGLDVDTAKQSLAIAGQPISLSRREFACLRFMIDNAETVITKATLLDQLYSADEPPLENAIEVLVSRLRKKIQPSAADVKTIRGVGYMIMPADKMPGETDGKSKP